MDEQMFPFSQYSSEGQQKVLVDPNATMFNGQFVLFRFRFRNFGRRFRSLRIVFRRIEIAGPDNTERVLREFHRISLVFERDRWHPFVCTDASCNANAFFTCSSRGQSTTLLRDGEVFNWTFNTNANVVIALRSSTREVKLIAKIHSISRRPEFPRRITFKWRFLYRHWRRKRSRSPSLSINFKP